MTVPQACADPQIAARRMLVEVEHPLAGKTVITGSPLKLSRTPAQIDKASPLLGADNEAVLTELLGLTPEDVEQLRREGVL
jgi:crotonobetainyl-CoA:carnitine CoA-transferase CaiB-like acyl-CoA transferase